MTACLDDYREPSPSFVSEGRLRYHSLCTKRHIVTECASELTEKTTLPQVMIKGVNFRQEKLLLLWLRGVDEGLSSL